MIKRRWSKHVGVAGEQMAVWRDAGCRMSAFCFLLLFCCLGIPHPASCLLRAINIYFVPEVPTSLFLSYVSKILVSKILWENDRMIVWSYDTLPSLSATSQLPIDLTERTRNIYQVRKASRKAKVADSGTEQRSIVSYSCTCTIQRTSFVYEDYD